jgi:hypothetical protein
MILPDAPAPVTSDVLLFSWNVKQSQAALLLACDYLAGAGNFIATFQEVPGDIDAAFLASAARGKLSVVKTLVIEISNKKKEDPLRYTQLVLACSAGLSQAAPTQWQDSRMIGASISDSAGAWGPVGMFAIHARSRESSHGARRLSKAIHARAHVDAYLPGSPKVVLGDFNANPYEAEICSPECFFALRNRDELSAKSNKEPLYNPFWSWLAEVPAHGPARGTLYYPSDESGFPWQCYDQILLSKDLIEHAQPSRIHCHLPRGADRQILTKKADNFRPKGPPYSDHLPVELSLRFPGGNKK